MKSQSPLGSPPSQHAPSDAPFPSPLSPEGKHWHQVPVLFRTINSIITLMLVFYSSVEQVQPGTSTALSWKVTVLAAFQFCFLNYLASKFRLKLRQQAELRSRWLSFNPHKVDYSSLRICGQIQGAYTGSFSYKKIVNDSFAKVSGSEEIEGWVLHSLLVRWICKDQVKTVLSGFFFQVCSHHSLEMLSSFVNILCLDVWRTIPQRV